MLTDLFVLIAAAIAAGAVLSLSIFLLNHMRTPTEELKRIEKQIDDFPHLPLQNEGAFGTKPINNNAVIIKTEGIKSPSELLKQLSNVDKGIMTVNEARIKAGIEPFNEFQKVAHDFGETKTPPTAENKRGTIRTARICQNCGSNMFESTKSIFSITCAYCGTTYETNKSIFDD